MLDYFTKAMLNRKIFNDYFKLYFDVIECLFLGTY